MARTGNKNAWAVKKVTGWSYNRSLRFVKDRDRSREAGIYMKEEDCSKRAAFVEIAKAHVEVEKEEY